MHVQRGFVGILQTNIDQAVFTVYQQTRENISKTCHTLERLAAMGHPYAVRNPNIPHSPEYLVHEHTGTLRRSLDCSKRAVATPRDKPTLVQGWVGCDEGRCAWARYVIFGTSKMVPRDFLTGSLLEKKKEVKKILKNNLYPKNLVKGIIKFK